jgi:hypothetical protein
LLPFGGSICLIHIVALGIVDLNNLTVHVRANDPSPRLVFSTFVKSSCFGVQKHSRRIDDPMLPLVTDNDADPLNVPLMIPNETRVRLKSHVAFPTVERGNVDQQPDLPALRDHWVDLLREGLEVRFCQLLRGNYF